MLYSILIYAAEGVFDRLPPDEQEAILQRHRDLQAKLAARGAFAVARLMPVSNAVTLKPTPDAAGKPLVVDGPIGGFAPFPSETGAWTVYVTVEDVDACLAKAAAAGAQILDGPTDAEGVGRMATIADPQGARIALITYESMQK